jgi:hypothetical protein
MEGPDAVLGEVALKPPCLLTDCARAAGSLR